MDEVNEAPVGPAAAARRRPVPVAASGFIRFLHAVVGQRFLWVPFALIFVYYLVVQVDVYGRNVGEWDVLLLSGWATLTVALVVARAVPARMRVTLQRLVDRHVLDLDESELQRLVKALEARGMRWGGWTGAVVVVAIGVAFVFAYSKPALLQRIPLAVLEAIGGYVAGLQLGRMASYGALGAFLRRNECRLEVWPGHVDGAAGLKPLGDFYFFQAMIAAVPAIFLAVWWFLIPLKGTRYDYWRDPYVGLLVPAIALEVLAFVVPIWSFHKEMVKKKLELLREADQLSAEMLTEGDAGEVPDQKKYRLERAKERYLAIEHMPTWPVDIKTRRRFRLNNAALFVPLLGQAVGQTELGKRVSEILKGLG